MHNAIPIYLGVLVSVGIIVIGYFYVVSPQRISGGFGLKSPASDSECRLSKKIRTLAQSARPRMFRDARGAMEWKYQVSRRSMKSIITRMGSVAGLGEQAAVVEVTRRQVGETERS